MRMVVVNHPACKGLPILHFFHDLWKFDIVLDSSFYISKIAVISALAVSLSLQLAV